MKRNKTLKILKGKFQDKITADLSFIEQIIVQIYLNIQIIYEHEHIALLDESMEAFISKSFNMALLHSGCTKAVRGEAWLQHFLQPLTYEE